MRIDRAALLKHLNRIHCEKQIGEVVLSTDFRARAMTVDQLFLVIVPPLEEVTPLPQEVGVIDLKRFITYLDTNHEDPRVSVEFDEGTKRLTITERRDNRVVQYSMVTGSPQVIGTAVRDDIFETILEALPPLGSEVAVTLNAAVVDDIKTAQEKIKSDLMYLTVAPNGSELRIGEDTGDWARVELPLLTAEEPYSLRLRSGLVVDALKQVQDYTQTFLTVTGPEDMVAIDCSGYRYIISPEDQES